MCIQDLIISRHTLTKARIVGASGGYVSIPANPRRLWVGCFDGTNGRWMPARYFERSTSTLVNLNANGKAITQSLNITPAADQTVTLASDNTGITANLAGTATMPAFSASGSIDQVIGSPIITVKDWPGIASYEIRFEDFLSAGSGVVFEGYLDDEFDTILQQYERTMIHGK